MINVLVLPPHARAYYYSCLMSLSLLPFPLSFSIPKGCFHLASPSLGLNLL